MDCSNPLVPTATAIYAALNARPVSDAAKRLIDHLTDLIEEHERHSGARQRGRKNTRWPFGSVSPASSQSPAEKKSSDSKGLHSSPSAPSMGSKADQRRLTVKALGSE